MMIGSVLSILQDLCDFMFIKHVIGLLRWILSPIWSKTQATPNVGASRDQQTNRTRPQLSLHAALMRPEYDIVVIGSGYGGGVAASRMARTGKSVCVLERGAELWPGEYPHTLKAALIEYHVRGRLLRKNVSMGKRSGLYHTTKGEGQDVFSGCGLGGTSLINAGVFLRADARVLKGKEWPDEISNNSDCMDQYYERAERMLGPSPYPSTAPKPQKLAIFEDQAAALDLKDRLYRPPLTTSFNAHVNHAVNDGSKNSILVTYIADAWNRGAEIFCGIDVQYIRKAEQGQGYLVYYENGGGKNATKKELVLLGAGVLGTTEVLLRSRSYGLSTSPLLGQRISGNGDLLAFAWNTNRAVNSIGRESPSDSKSERCGPVITGCIDLRDTEAASNVRYGYVIQDGAVPQALAPVFQTLINVPATTVEVPPGRRVDRTIAALRSWVLGPYCDSGSVQRTAVYLVMSHDDVEGRLEIDGNAVSLRWNGVGTERKGSTIKEVLSKATRSIHGSLVKAPHLTVHPLGGACMSNDGTGLGGVVSHRGQLYCGSEQELYSGIFCMDASVIPASLGVNPCATITALAERTCDLIIRERQWEVNDGVNGELNLNGKPQARGSTTQQQNKRSMQFHRPATTCSISFDEVLNGFLHIGTPASDLEVSKRIGKLASNAARLSITVNLYCSRASYEGLVTGSMTCGAISRDPLLITRGLVKFFTVDPDVSDAVNLVYDFDLLGTTGEVYHFHGYKRIDPSITLALLKTWRATTTLYTTITSSDGSTAAQGLLNLSLRGFTDEILSFRSTPKVTIKKHIFEQMAFMKFFAQNLARYEFSLFRPLLFNSKMGTINLYENPKPRHTWVTAEDGVRFPLKIWDPLPHVVPKLTPIVLIPGAAVNEQIFSLPTIPTNTIDYFTSRGYRCYIPILRFGIPEEAKKGWTVFDARIDVKAALQYIRDQEKGRKIYAIVHCLGSIAMASALLAGDADVTWLCGMTSSQVFTDLIYSRDNEYKARHGILLSAYRVS
ncbi:FAD/NAD(P)-binding domain-containing protein [Plenodomus tracheiphilus IPT5]|uniref:Cholesterol oxidase n=1 Tax=Plenodomus tracheiphilus IPT5 TaxID=1408161 RepID=A0A6A7B0X3_9PLEO|nr:FAD/NAD(P)-binding domain-containing protein [Plenodomus tracheiphilus IPT5]